MGAREVAVAPSSAEIEVAMPGSTTPGTPRGRRGTNTPSPALKKRQLQRYEDKRDMDVNNYDLENRINYCQDLRRLKAEFDEIKNGIEVRVKNDIEERIAFLTQDNEALEGKIEGLQGEKQGLLDEVRDLDVQLKALLAEVKRLQVQRPKAEKERDAAAERRRLQRAEIEDLRMQLNDATKEQEALLRGNKVI